MEVPPLLASRPLFAGFRPDELAKLWAAGEVRTLEPGEAIIRRGEPGRFLGFILAGRVEAVGPDEEGVARRLGELGEGDCFGEISLISGEATTADVRAIIPSQVLLIPQEALSAALVSHPTALQQLARTVTQRLRQMLPRAFSETPREPSAPAAPADEGAGTQPVPAKVLVLESGADSLRYTYCDVNCELRNREGVVTGLGGDQGQHAFTVLRGETTTAVPGTRAGALEAVLASLTGPDGELHSLDELSAIAHRIAHGGERFAEPAVIDDEVLGELRTAGAPSASLELLEAARRLAPNVKQVAVFETAFFQSLPPQAFLYALPYELYRESGLRRHGADGLTHHQAALSAAAHLDQPLRNLRLVSCCLGPRSSVCAVMDGRAVETSDLLPGPDTAGDVDSGLVFRLGREQGLSLAELEALLAERSGLRALSGLSGDPAELEAASTEGHSRAALALDLFAHSVKREIGACVVVLGALDALTFTGPWGESAAGLRARICRGFPALGVRLDPNLNQTPEADSDGVSDLAEPGSLARILVVPTDIHRMVAAEALAALGRRELAALLRSRRRPIPISISAHHLHLRQEHVEALFGAGHQLTFRSPLSQPGQFACEEAVTLVGPRGRVERVRVLGPVRRDTQVEISRTEEFRLGIDAPVRASGDIHGSPGLRLEGPSDVVDLPEGVIIAARHVHMSPEDALRFGVRDRDAIAVRVEGERGISFRDVVVRVHPDFRLDMHVDTDEGNAAELGPDAVGYMEGIERRV